MSNYNRGDLEEEWAIASRREDGTINISPIGYYAITEA